MDFDRTVYSFSELGKLINKELNENILDPVMDKAALANSWFSAADTRSAIRNIIGNYLDENKLKKWLAAYNISAPASPQTVAIVMAGNIPLVGFHDLLCVLASGHRAQIKLSSKDEVLPKYFISKLIEIDRSFEDRINIADRLSNFNAVVATGSNNTSRYFEYYFGKYPHIIRKGRNSVAILTGNESSRELFDLGVDIFSFFGLGCRNVSKLYVPEGYDFIPLLDALMPYKEIDNFFKYDNNYSYHKSILLINSVPHYDTGFLLVKEDKSLASAVSCLHYEFYKNDAELKALLDSQEDAIQCIVGDVVRGLANIRFGKSQSPELWDYADNVDTMEFLKGLSDN